MQLKVALTVANIQLLLFFGIMIFWFLNKNIYCSTEYYQINYMIDCFILKIYGLYNGILFDNNVNS